MLNGTNNSNMNIISMILVLAVLCFSYEGWESTLHTRATFLLPPVQFPFSDKELWSRNANAQVHEITLSFRFASTLMEEQEEEKLLNQNISRGAEWRNLISFDEWSCSNVDVVPYNFVLYTFLSDFSATVKNEKYLSLFVFNEAGYGSGEEWAEERREIFEKEIAL
jgi:hypothetical protein